MQKTYTKTILGKEARSALKRGIDAVNAPVSVTMGARGRNAAYREYGYPKITNDGVNIARRIIPYDDFECMGADLAKEGAEKTVKEAGDGTTGTIVVIHELSTKGMEAVDSGSDPMKTRADLEKAKDEVLEQIKKMAIPVKSREDILNVARISVEDEGMAQIVADAVEKSGKYGAVIVEEGSGYGIEVEQIKGYHWDRGYVSPYMMTNPETEEAILDDCIVIVTDRYMNLNKDLMQTLNECVNQGAKSALIIADRVEGELLQSLIINKTKGIFVSVAVSKPNTLDELEDIAVLTNSTAITKDKGIKAINWGHIGKAKRVIVSKNKTTIICDDSSAVSERVNVLSESLKTEKNEEIKEALVERLAKLADGMILIRVGAKTESERKYRKDKMDDAVAAAKAATEEGIVPGGGVALLKIAEGLDNEILASALRAPYETILKNAGLPVDGKYRNIKTGEVVKDMIAEGIIDPAKVIRCIVEHAVSLVGILLTIESVTVGVTEEKGTTQQ